MKTENRGGGGGERESIRYKHSGGLVGFSVIRRLLAGFAAASLIW